MTASHYDRPEKDTVGEEDWGEAEYHARGETPPPPEGESHAEHGFRGEWLKDISYRFEPELIEGILPAIGLGFLYGASSAGKSFIAIDWALSLVSSAPVLGRVTLHSGVLYVAAEGQAGMRKRLVAARRYHQLDDADLPFNFLPAFIDLGDANKEEVERVLAYARECSVDMQNRGAPLRLVIIDTMAAAAPSVDENTAKDMGPLIFRLQKLAADLNCLVLVIAHVGKDEARGLRGWSGSRAAADVAIECRVVRENPKEPESPVKRRYIWLEKAKDGTCGLTVADFDLCTVEVGRKPSGEPDTTCCIQYSPPSPDPATSDKAAKAAAQAHETEALRWKVLNALTEVLTDKWCALRNTAARLKVSAGITSSRDPLMDILRALGGDEPGGITKIPHAGGAIHVRTQRGRKNTTFHFRFVRDL